MQLIHHFKETFSNFFFFLVHNSSYDLTDSCPSQRFVLATTNCNLRLRLRKPRVFGSSLKGEPSPPLPPWRRLTFQTMLEVLTNLSKLSRFI